MTRPLGWTMALAGAVAGAPLLAQQAPPASAPMIPGYSRDPVKGDLLSDDPLLRIGRETVPEAVLADVIRQTIARAPSTAEALATREEAAAALAEARAARSPSLDLTISSYKVIDRNFGGSAENVIERSRPGRRTDLLLNADQLLLDAGGASNRIGAAAERLRAAGSDVESSVDRVALDTVAAWYDLFTFRALVQLGAAFVDSQRDLRASIEERIRRGVSAEADLARVDSYIASAEARLARFRRQLGQSEARFQALTGSPPPSTVARVTAPGPMSRDLALTRALESPAVRAARAGAEAARRDAKAARADLLPTLSAGIESGRYGIYETPRDYDIRGRLTIRQRLFGGIGARADQATARANGAGARADRVREDAARDAEIAWSDVQVLAEQRRALEASYIASRRSRDVVVERFRVASGTLFDVLGTEDAYFETAVGYLQAVTELDAARYVLLSRTGTLLSTLDVPPPVLPAVKGYNP